MSSNPPSVLSPPPSLSNPSTTSSAFPTDYICPAAVLEEEIGLHPPSHPSTASTSSKLPQYRLFYTSNQPPPGTLRTHRHAALPSSKHAPALACDFDGASLCGTTAPDDPIPPPLPPFTAPQDVDLPFFVLCLRRGGDEATAALRQLLKACDATPPPLDEDNPLLTRILQHDAQSKDRVLPFLFSTLSSNATATVLMPGAQMTLYMTAALLAYLSTGSLSQCQHLIEVGLLPHLLHLLQHHRTVHVRVSEAALTCLGNVCAYPTCRSVALVSGSVDLLAAIIRLERAPAHRYFPMCSCIDCRSTPSRRLAMWTLSLLARSCALSASSPTSASVLLTPLIPLLCQGFEFESDPDISTHLVFFFYSLTASSSSQYNFPMSPAQQAAHWRLCSLVPVALYPTFVQLLGHEELNVVYGALSIISNLVFSSAHGLSALLQAELLHGLTRLYTSVREQSLSEANVLIHAQINFIVSVIAASPSHDHLMALMRDTPLVDAMICDVSSGVLEISKEATWALGNLTRGYWRVQRKDREGRYPLAAGGAGGDEERETKERRTLLSRKEGLVRSLCSLLSLEFEEDEEHCTLMQVALVSITNLLSDEWWVYSVLNTAGPAGLKRAEEIRRSSSKAMEVAQTLSQSIQALRAQGLVAASITRGESTSHDSTMSDDSAFSSTDGHSEVTPLPPFPCFNPSQVLSHHPNALTFCAFPTASPLHPPELHPASAAFLACRGLALLGRLELSSLHHVSKYAEWVMCMMFTEFCSQHDLHRRTAHTDTRTHWVDAHMQPPLLFSSTPTADASSSPSRVVQRRASMKGRAATSTGGYSWWRVRVCQSSGLHRRRRHRRESPRTATGRWRVGRTRMEASSPLRSQHRNLWLDSDALPRGDREQRCVHIVSWATDISVVVRVDGGCRPRIPYDQCVDRL